jgi:hypothetical protein
VAATATEASIAPPPPVPAATVVEGETATGAPASCAALVSPTKAGPSREDAVVIVDEDPAALPLSENRNVVIPPASEPTQVTAITSLLPDIEMPVPSPAVDVFGILRRPRRWRSLLRPRLPSPRRR